MPVCTATAVLLLVAGTCTRKPADDLPRLVPSLPPKVAAHLVGDDAQGLREFARRAGRTLIARSYYSMWAAPPVTSVEEFAHVDSVLAPYRRRLAEVMGVEFGEAGPLGTQILYGRLPAAERLQVVQLLQEISVFNAQAATQPIESRAQGLLEFMRRCEPYADVIHYGDLYGEYATILQRLHRANEMPHCLRRGVEIALAHHDSSMACQLLGTLGCYYEEHGVEDSMWICYDRALGIARERDSWQEVRVLNLMGSHYRSQGQLAITRDLFLEGQDRCREMRASEPELRFLIDALNFFAGLDCWDIVGRGLERADIVGRAGRKHLWPPDAELESIRLQVLRARYAAWQGRRHEARKLALAADQRAAHWSLGTRRAAVIRLDAARALAACGLAHDVRSLLEQRTPADADIDSTVAAELAMELAGAYLDLGELGACGGTLEACSPDPGSRLSVQQAILRLRLAMQSGDPTAEFARLAEALQRLDDMTDAHGASPEGYIALATTDELRRLGHELLDRSPEAGYAFEMRWRSPAGRRPRFRDASASETAFVAALVAEARQARACLAARDAVHCVYDVRDDRIVRFTARADGISEQLLPVATAELRSRVERVCTDLHPSSGGAGRLGAEQAARLRDLATWLLPDDVRQGAASLFLVTATDCLSRLPFETFNLADDGYAPLLGRLDVATLRYWSSVSAPAGDAVLVVSQPSYSAALRRRYSILTESLPVSAIEAASVRQLIPGALSLHGANATKRAVVERWQDARLLYFATHLVQDPELPYIMFIPMAEDANGHEGDSYLEVADVRGADLCRCRLVVLSACASGAPYLNGRVHAPSLADVFLDAGARSLVSTAWAVRDEDAASLMGAFMRLYAEDERDPIGALCRARREVAASTPDPRAWAAYSIAVNALEPSATRRMTLRMATRLSSQTDASEEQP